MRNFDASWFSRKRDFSISVFCAVSSETKLETEKAIGTCLWWVCSKVEILKKRGVVVGVVLLIWTKLAFFGRSTLQLFPFSAETKLEMVLPGGLGSELLRTFTPNSEMPPNNGTRFALIFWFLLSPEAVSFKILGLLLVFFFLVFSALLIWKNHGCFSF